MPPKRRLDAIAASAQVEQKRRETGRLCEPGTDAFIQTYRALCDVRPRALEPVVVSHLHLVSVLRELRAHPERFHPTPPPLEVTPFHRTHVLQQRTSNTASLQTAQSLLLHKQAIDDLYKQRVAAYTPEKTDRMATILITSHGIVNVTDDNKTMYAPIPPGMHVLRATAAAPGIKSELENEDVAALLKVFRSIYNFYRLQSHLKPPHPADLYHLLVPFLHAIQDTIHTRLATPHDFVTQYIGMQAMMYDTRMLSKTYERTAEDVEFESECHVLLFTDESKVVRLLPDGPATIETEEILQQVSARGYTSVLFLDLSCNHSERLGSVEELDDTAVNVDDTEDDLYARANEQLRQVYRRDFMLGGKNDNT